MTCKNLHPLALSGQTRRKLGGLASKIWTCSNQTQVVASLRKWMQEGGQTVCKSAQVTKLASTCDDLRFVWPGLNGEGDFFFALRARAISLVCENWLVLIYSKLHSKSCDYLFKSHGRGNAERAMPFGWPIYCILPAGGAITMRFVPSFCVLTPFPLRVIFLFN